MSMFARTDSLTRRRALFEAERAASRALRDEFGTSFRIYDATTGGILDEPPSPRANASLEIRSPAAVLEIAAEGRPLVRFVPPDRYELIMPLVNQGGASMVAIGEIPTLAADLQGFREERERLLKWLQSFHRQLSLTGPPSEMSANANVSRELLPSYLKAVLELDDLIRTQQLSGVAMESRDHLLRRVAELLPVEALILLPMRADESILVKGRCPLTTDECGRLGSALAGYGRRDDSGCIILNEAPAVELGVPFPSLRNVMAIPLDGREAGGWLIALNKVACQERPGTPADGVPTRSAVPAPFRRTDAALAMPFAALLGLQSRIACRKTQVHALFTGLTRCLTAAIDARDSYTFGHSERVARMSVELGRELGLDEHELSDIYLGGLLHDIGKIGIPDSILIKRGPLTPGEIEQIRQHVHIGCRILADFHAIRHLLPLVLHHHERYDGAGYPHGLKGDEIPLAARILAVADSYDAMSTARPYRESIPRPQIERTLAQGRDGQWDALVIDAFFRARERIYAIEERGVGQSVCLSLDNAFRPSVAHANSSIPTAARGRRQRAEEAPAGPTPSRDAAGAERGPGVLPDTRLVLVSPAG